MDTARSSACAIFRTSCTIGSMYLAMSSHPVDSVVHLHQGFVIKKEHPEYKVQGRGTAKIPLHVEIILTWSFQLGEGCPRASEAPRPLPPGPWR